MSTRVMNMSYRICLWILVLLFWFGQAKGEEQAAPPESYTLKLFTDDTVLRNPNSSAYGYFDIYPWVTVTEPLKLDLWYSYSPTTRSDLSSITISLNGIPVVSRPLEGQQAPMTNWQVMLPVQYVKTGPNEISVAVVHRSIDGLCRDIDNEANWFIIKPQTGINFKTSHAPYTLASYPRPFVDDYLAAKINTVVYLPNDPDQITVAALLNLASDWGARGLAGVPHHLEVRLGEPGQLPANEVVLGLTSRWQPSQNIPDGAAVLTQEELPGGFSRLLVTGDNSGDMAKAVDVLRRPQLVNTFTGRQAILSEPLPPEPEGDGSLAGGSKTTYTLPDLGYKEDISAAGAFHQEVVLTVPRPPNYKIGDGSYIELHFRHSKAMDPKKSAVTVYIDDIPLRSLALTAENAENGILKVPVPVSELNKSSWNIHIGFYHDLGIIDCSKRYDEVAWSVVEKETNIYFAPGNIERAPMLEDFPNSFLVGQDGIVNLTMLIPDNPSQEELNAAFKLAYFIGRQNKSRLVWQVQTFSSFDETKAVGSIIALGKNDDPRQWGVLQKYLPVFPEFNGGYHVSSWVEVLPSALRVFDICQVAKIGSKKLLYAFMYSSPGRMNNFLSFLLKEGNRLSGQVALVNSQGTNLTFAERSNAAKDGRLAWLKDMWSRVGGATGMYLTIFAAVLAGTLALMFYTRRRP